MSELKLTKSEDIRPECNFCFSDKDIHRITGKGFLQVSICEKCLNDLNKQANEADTSHDKALDIDLVSGCFPTEKEVEQAAESFGNLYSQDPNFANGCEAGWNAGANWMKEKYKDSNNR